jgi:hypothetical protein
MTGILIYSLRKEEGFIEVMRYDIERIKRDADCRIVAASIGMKVNGQFCECVSGIHSETQINHCSLTKEYYHCFSCGDAGDVVTMVRKYYENILASPISIAESCKIIGDVLGGHEYYRREEEDSRKQVEEPPFLRTELELLGFVQPNYREDILPIKMEQIYSRSKEFYYQLIREKALSEAKRIRILYQILGDSRTPVKDALVDRYKKVKEIYLRACDRSKEEAQREQG